jgi:hypothetical protein
MKTMDTDSKHLKRKLQANTMGILLAAAATFISLTLLIVTVFFS